MKRTIASLLLGVSLVVGSTVARPAPRASADCSVAVAVVLGIVTFGFGDAVYLPTACGAHFTAADASTCKMGDIDVSGNATVHSYRFSLADCTTAQNAAAFNAQVSAAYDVNSQKAREKLTGDGWTIEADWTCSSDPWIAPLSGEPVCVFGHATENPDASAYMPADLSQPFSAALLTDFLRSALDAQLQNALNQKPAPKPSPSAPAASTNRGTTDAATSIVVAGKPSDFNGKRINQGGGSAVLLTWDPSSAVSFYMLRAVSHQDGKTPLDVGEGAGDIGAANDTLSVNGQQVTGFIANSTAASVPGGADYFIKGCSAPGQCGGEATVFVPGP